MLFCVYVVLIVWIFEVYVIVNVVGFERFGGVKDYRCIRIGDSVKFKF